METITQPELEDIFIDVRKAYRLLYLYQRRVLDTINFIASAVSKSYVEGHSYFSQSHKNTKQINFDSWAWDWLPMFCYEFRFAEEKIENDSYVFSITVYADNGFEDAKDYVTQTNVEQFVSVENSQTQIYFQLKKNVADWNDDYDVLWSSKHSPEFELKSNEIQFLSLRFPLSQFADEENIIQGLREFKSYCKDKGIIDFFKQEF